MSYYDPDERDHPAERPTGGATADELTRPLDPTDRFRLDPRTIELGRANIERIRAELNARKAQR